MFKLDAAHVGTGNSDDRPQIHALRLRSSASSVTSPVILMVGTKLVDRLPFPANDLTSSLPIADRASLVGLSDNDVQTWSAAKADEYRRFALTLLSIYNAVTPIHRLHFEILSKIFQGCWTDRKSFRIGHVCRRWRSVLLNAPRFWAEAVNGEKFSPDDRSLNYLDVVLERSAPRTMDPSFSRFSARISRSLTPHARRVVSLEVSLANDSELFPLWSCLNSGMSSLGTLTIALDNDDGPWNVHAPIENLSLSSTALPRLSRVTAPVGLLPSLALPGLQHVTLKNAFGRHGPNGRLESSEWFRDALTICAANLQSLVLLGAVPWVYTDTSPLSFPALQHLRVKDTTRHCALILSRFTLPKTTHIHCTNTNGGGLCNTIPTITFNRRGPIQSSLRATDRVAIISDTEATSVHCYSGEEERLCIGLAGGQRNLRSDDLVELFCLRAHVRELTVAMLDGLDAFGVEFRAFPHLIHVAIRGNMASHILEHLSHTEDGGRVVSPSLETLVIDFHSQFRYSGDSDALEIALRNKDIPVVEADLRERCAELQHVLRQRSWRKLTRLEFGCTYKGRRAGSSHRKYILDSTDSNWVSWRPIVEPLEPLVNGPVVFTGYGFFLADGQ